MAHSISPGAQSCHTDIDKRARSPRASAITDGNVHRGDPTCNCRIREPARAALSAQRTAGPCGSHDGCKGLPPLPCLPPLPVSSPTAASLAPLSQLNHCLLVLTLPFTPPLPCVPVHHHYSSCFDPSLRGPGLQSGTYAERRYRYVWVCAYVRMLVCVCVCAHSEAACKEREIRGGEVRRK